MGERPRRGGLTPLSAHTSLFSGGHRLRASIENKKMTESALHDLLVAAEAAAADWSAAAVSGLGPAVEAARAAAAMEGGSGEGAALLEAALAQAGWSSGGDRCTASASSSFDARALVCALKANQLSDLEHLGEGTFATCYKVREGSGGDEKEERAVVFSCFFPFQVPQWPRRPRWARNGLRNLCFFQNWITQHLFILYGGL